MDYNDITREGVMCCEHVLNMTEAPLMSCHTLDIAGLYKSSGVGKGGMCGRGRGATFPCPAAQSITG